jgi:hypothetical protein
MSEEAFAAHAEYYGAWPVVAEARRARDAESALDERLRVAREALGEVCDVTPDGPLRMEDRLYRIAEIAAAALERTKP